jgi:coenzyme F420-reducing hydrogenase delta subunit
MDFEPKIIGFLCNWCSYAGADLCGVSRYQYPTNIRVVRVMCSGRIDPSIIISVFLQGADGVFVGGCHPGDCHYLSGNYQAQRKIELTKKLLEKAGLESARIRLEWISASEGERFSLVMKEFTEQIRKLGPNPIHKYPGMDKSISAARDAATTFRLRILVGIASELAEKGNAYGEKLSQESINQLMDRYIEVEYAQNKILQVVKDKPLSVREISDLVNLSPRDVLQHIIVMKRKNLIAMAGIDGFSPKYLALPREV